LSEAMQHDKRQRKVQLKGILHIAIIATGFGAFGALFVANGEWVPGLIMLGIALVLIASQAVRAWRPQAAAPTEGPRRQRPLVETSPLLVVLIGVPFAVVALVLVASGEWLAGLVPASVCLLLLAGVGLEITSRRLGREMRSPEHTEADALSSVPTAEIIETSPAPLLPVPPFATTVYDADNVPPISESTKAFIEQRRQIFIESIYLFRRGAEFLWCWLAGLLLFGLLFTGVVPPNTGFIWWGLALHMLMRVFKSNKSWDILLWLWCCFLNIAWFGGIVYVVYYYARGMFSGQQTTRLQIASVLLILLASLGVFLYLHKMRRERNTLLQKALANRPVKLLFLWVFGSYAVGNSLLQGLGVLWGMFGSMQVLRGRGYMGSLNELVPAALGRKQAQLVETPEQLQAQIKTWKLAPHWMGRYYTNSLICHDQVWELALHTVLADTDVVVMNLGGFSSENEGCIYELGQLIDRLPTQRFLLLVDQTTDMEALVGILQRAWNDMAPNSPNRASSGPIQLYRVKWLNVPLSARQESLDAVHAEEERLVQILCEGLLQVNPSLHEVSPSVAGAAV
jgi:hypothetical protein